MITLIGMSGVGKSSVGRELADLLSWNFLDSDRVMEERCNGEPLPEVLQRLGEVAFLEFEATVVQNLNPAKDTVLATGGSVVYHEKTMQYLYDISYVIHLDADIETLVGRADLELDNPRAYARRSIVRCGTRNYEQLYHQRTPRYRKWANLTVDTVGRTPDKVAFEIRSVFR